MSGCIGIDIGPRAVRYVTLTRRLGKTHVVTSGEVQFSQQNPSDVAAELELALQEIGRRSERSRKMPVVVGLPFDQVFFCEYTTEIHDIEEVRRLLRFELEDDVPVSFDDLVTDIYGSRSLPDGTYAYFVGATSRNHLHALHDAAMRSGHRCLAISSHACALETVTQACHVEYTSGAEIVLYVDSDRMIVNVVDNGTIINARHLPYIGSTDDLSETVAHEIGMTLRATYGRGFQGPLKIRLCSAIPQIQELSARLASLIPGCEVDHTSLSSLSELTVEAVPGPEYTLGLGLAAAGLGGASRLPNFLDVDIVETEKVARSKVKRTAFVSIAFLVAILGVLGAKMYFELRSLEAQHDAIDTEMRAVFNKAFPHEPKVVNELAQMTEHLDLLKKERDMLAATVGKQVQPLSLLHIFSEKLTSDKGVKVSSFSVTGQKIRVSGTGQSFDAVEQFRKELRQVSCFGVVELEDVKLSSASNQPEFTLLMTMRGQ